MRRRLCVLNYYVRTCPCALNCCILKHLCSLIFYVPIYIFHAFLRLCLQLFCVLFAHFSRTYVFSIMQNVGADIYPADVKSDKNKYFNTSNVVSQNLLAEIKSKV